MYIAIPRVLVDHESIQCALLITTGRHGWTADGYDYSRLLLHHALHDETMKGRTAPLLEMPYSKSTDTTDSWSGVAQMQLSTTLVRGIATQYAHNFLLTLPFPPTKHLRYSCHQIKKFNSPAKASRNARYSAHVCDQTEGMVCLRVYVFCLSVPGRVAQRQVVHMSYR